MSLCSSVKKRTWENLEETLKFHRGLIILSSALHLNALPMSKWWAKLLNLEVQRRGGHSVCLFFLCFVQGNKPGDGFKTGSGLFATVKEEEEEEGDKSSRNETITMLFLRQQWPKLCFHWQESKKTPENNRGRRQGATVPGTQRFVCVCMRVCECVCVYARACACTHAPTTSTSLTAEQPFVPPLQSPITLISFLG